MKINLSNLKDKILSKNEQAKPVNKVNIISICVFVIGVIIAFIMYFFTKNIINSVLILIVALLITLGLYFYSSYVGKKKNKDGEISVKIDFINRLVERLLAKQSVEDSIIDSAKEIKSSSFKDLIISSYNQEDNKFNKIEFDTTLFNYDNDLQEKLNYMLNKKINVNSLIQELLKIKDEMVKLNTNLEYKMYEYTTFGVTVIFYVYFILSMIFN